jgi:hypothetical protein
VAIIHKELTMRRHGFRFLALLGLLAAPGAWAADYITVESKTVAAGATDVTVAIRLANSDTLMGFALPLEIRSLTLGCRPASLRMEYAERLTETLQDYRTANQYTAKDGVCWEGGAPAYQTPLTQTADTTVSVTHSPWGIMFGGLRFMSVNSLWPGVDSSGSLLLHMDMTGVPGSFEIDTVCIYPANHAVYVRVLPYPGAPRGIYPNFTKGVITLVDCNCSHHGDIDGDEQLTSLDLGLLIDYIFASGDAPPTDVTCPHIDRGDVDCTGFDDASDVARMVDILFAAGSACDPCDCDPYPASCP